MDLKGTPSVTQVGGFELKDFGKQTVSIDDAEGAPAEVFEAYVTVIRCPRCFLEGVSRVDEQVAALGGNAAAFRAAEDNAFMKIFLEKHAAARPNCR